MRISMIVVAMFWVGLSILAFFSGDGLVSTIQSWSSMTIAAIWTVGAALYKS